MKFSDRMLKFFDSTEYYRRKLEQCSRTTNAPPPLKNPRKKFFPRVVKVARDLSKVIGLHIIKCKWCGTPYTEYQINRMESATCINCGGDIL